VKRILLFVHYNKKDKLDYRIIYTLKNIKHLFNTVIVISNSNLSENDKSLLKNVSDKVILRDNFGYDFSAWKDGINSVGWSNIKKYDTLTIMNDTCHCPIWPIDKYFKKFDKKLNVDFWGASLHRATNYGMPGSNEPVPEHIQSYFMTFKRNVIKSRAFIKFWDGIEAHSDVKKVIRDYEVGITKTLSDSGFKYDAIVNTKNSVFAIKTIVNPTFQDPLSLLAQKFPFVKLKAISKINFLKIKNFVSNNSKYPAKHINMYGKERFLRPIIYAANFLLNKTHLAFLAISVPTVMAFSIITPPGFGGDEMSHALRAYSISQGQLFTVNNEIPNSLRDTVKYGWDKAESALWGTQFYHRQDLSDQDSKTLTDLGNKEINSNETTVVKFSNTDPYSIVVYLGAAFGFGIGEALDLSVHLTIILARLLNAIPFFVLGAFAIYVLRKKTERWLIFTVLLLPTVSSYVATINGDPYNIASVVLFFAVFLHFIGDNKKMSKKKLLLLAVSSILLSFAKLPSVLLVGLLFFIKKDRFNSVKDKWLKVSGIAIVTIFVALVSMSTGLTGTLGNKSVATEKISWSITHPIDTVALFGRTIVEESPDYLNRAVGVMGRNGVFMHGIIIMIIYIWLTILALSIDNTGKKKGLLILAYASIMCATVIGLLYIGDSSNKIGEQIILGVHGKYFTPFIVMAFYGLGALSPFRISSNKNYVGLMTVALMILVSIASILIYELALY
jgi:uncharacterized membrane protein